MKYSGGGATKFLRKDKDGNLVYYPWGILGWGYVLADEASAARATAFMMRWNYAMLATAFPLALFAGTRVAILGLFVCGAAFNFSVNSYFKDAPSSPDPFTAKLALQDAAARHSRRDIKLLSVFCVLLSLLGFAAARTAPSPYSFGFWIFGGTAMACSSLVFAYMLRVKPPES